MTLARDLKEGMMVSGKLVWRDFVEHNFRAIGVIDGCLASMEPDLEIETTVAYVPGKAVHKGPPLIMTRRTPSL